MPNLFDEIDLTVDNFNDVMSNFKTSTTMFTNSECVFIEYYDLINAPWLVLMSLIWQNKSLPELFDFTPITDMNVIELFETYCTRETRNFLHPYLKKDKMELANQLDSILDTMCKSKILFDMDFPLSTRRIVSNILSDKCARKIKIYTEKYNECVENDILSLFGKHSNLTYVYGSFKDIVKEQIPPDTLYIFSDHYKIVELSEIDRLSLSAILLANGYRYNMYQKYGEWVPNINMEYFGKDQIFKYAYFDPFY